MLTLNDVTIANKRVLIREDLNVPCVDGKILNDARIRAALPTIEQALAAKARVIVVSHFGRPKPGADNAEFSLRIVADKFKELLPEYSVKFVVDWLSGVNLEPGELIVTENIRFFPGETENDPKLAKQIAALCEVFVMDAFGVAHRAHASTAGVIKYAKQAVAGPLLLKEIQALDQFLQRPASPVVAVVGGAKVSSKLPILKAVMQIADSLIVGGGIANTFLAAKGYEIGASLYEADMLVVARELLTTAKEYACEIILPKDAVVAKNQDDLNGRTVELGAAIENEFAAAETIATGIAENEKIFDIGGKTIAFYQESLTKAKTILWNGPVGLFESKQFAKGTNALALTIAASDAFSLAGGGETLAAIEQLNLKEQISFVSTGGGAFLEYLAGKELPGIVALGHR